MALAPLVQPKLNRRNAQRPSHLHKPNNLLTRSINLANREDLGADFSSCAKHSTQVQYGG